MRRIKNIEKLRKEELIITLLKSENSAEELNFKKLFNNNTKNDTYDDKIRGKISDIRMILSKLGNMVTNKDRKEIKIELYEIEKIEKKKNLQTGKKKRFMIILSIY